MNRRVRQIMELGQTIRKLGRDVRARIAGLQAQLASARSARAQTSAEAEPLDTSGHAAPWRVRPLLFTGIGGAIAPILFYVVSAWWMSVIDDDLAFAPKAGALQGHQSGAVAAVAALIDREVNGHGWTPNDPFFSPTALLDDMPNFQRGIIAALGRVTLALSETMDVQGASSESDSDLKTAADLLAYPPDVWLWNPSVSLWRGSSERQYRKAIAALNGYNARLALSDTAIGRSAPDLAAELDAIGADLDAEAGAIDTLVRTHANLFLDDAGGKLFYTVKGEVYAYDIVLKGLYRDFTPIIGAKGQSKLWDQMMASLEDGARMRPLVVLNGGADSEFVPCHLCNQGFYISRARERLRELADALRK
jgi:hypothetical protein